MTTPKSLEERAEEITEFVKTAWDKYLYAHDSCTDFILAHFREVFTEGTESHGVEGHRQCDKCVSEGFNTGLVKAAEVAENVKALSMEDGNDPCHCVEYELTPSMIAARIRKMEPRK